MMGLTFRLSAGLARACVSCKSDESEGCHSAARRWFQDWGMQREGLRGSVRGHGVGFVDSDSNDIMMMKGEQQVQGLRHRSVAQEHCIERGLHHATHKFEACA